MQHLHLFDTTELKLLLFDSVKASSPTYECSLLSVDISYNIELRKVISVVLLLQAHTNMFLFKYTFLCPPIVLVADSQSKMFLACHLTCHHKLC